MDRVRVGVIGLGWFGEKHCEALAAIPHVKLAAVCTRTPQRLEEVAARFDVEARYTDYRQLLAESADLVRQWFSAEAVPEH